MRAVGTWGLWGVLALGLALAWLGVQLPGPTPASAPAADFSAERAMAVVRDIGRAPHPIGSPEHARVRERLVARMAALGLGPQVREGVGVDQPKWNRAAVAAATVHNVLGVLPGRDPSLPALMLMAHYDSVPNSPGAADDAAGVATALETARALRATGPHARDVMVLITDGEESGLLGAESFFHGDPARAHVGIVLNMETRGDSGRAAMFEIGEDAGALVALYGRVAKNPDANSLTSYVYHALPNDTDFTHVRRAGLPGLNFAFIGDQLAYHTPLATPDHLSRASLQNMGDQVAPTALALADAQTLPPRAPDRVYSDLWGRWLIAYPPAAGWLVVLAAAALTAFAGWRAVRDGLTTRWEIARAVCVPVAALCGAALALTVAGAALGGADFAGQYHRLARPRLLLAATALILLGVVLLAEVGARRGRGRGPAALGAGSFALLACLLEGRLDPVALGLGAVLAGALFVALSRPLPMWSGWIGALMIGVALAAATQALAPMTAVLTAWPALLGAGTAAVAAALGPGRAGAGGLLVGATATLALAVLGGWVEALFTAIGVTTPVVMAVFVPLLLPVLHPLAAAWAEGPRRGLVGAAALVVGAALFAFAGLAPSPVDRPDLVQAFAYDEPAAGLHRRVSTLPTLSIWARNVLTAEGGAVAHGPLEPAYPFPVWSAPARAASEPAPRATLAQDGADLRLVGETPNGGQRLAIQMRSTGGLSLVRINGRETGAVAAPGGWLRLNYDAPPATGVELRARSSGAAEAVVAEITEGWPKESTTIPAKPPGTMAWGQSDRMAIVTRVRVP